MMLTPEDVRGPELVAAEVTFWLDVGRTVEVTFCCDVRGGRVNFSVEEELRPMDKVMMCRDVIVMTETSLSDAVGDADEMKEVCTSEDGTGYLVSVWVGSPEIKFVTVTVTVTFPVVAVCEAGSWLESKEELTSDDDFSPFEGFWGTADVDSITGLLLIPGDLGSVVAVGECPSRVEDEAENGSLALAVGRGSKLC